MRLDLVTTTITPRTESVFHFRIELDIKPITIWIECVFLRPKLVITALTTWTESVFLRLDLCTLGCVTSLVLEILQNIHC